MTVADNADFDGHEQVIFCSDQATGLSAIIAIHSSALGPAAGGCRMQPYKNEHDALTDVLRLSKGMSYKNALAGLPLGGAKSVIIADPERHDKPELLRAFARHVQSLGGRYWAAIDVGVGPDDADVLAEECDYIFARASQYEPGFNPSSFTALGGFTGIRAAASFRWGSDDLSGRRVAIQGLGATGADLAAQLHDAGATLVVSDVRQDAAQAIVDRFDAEECAPDMIHAQDVDIFAPCALGGVINETTLPQIKAQIVCGLANNQLAEPRHGQVLHEKGITYVPDYVVNAGGMMGASTVIFSTPSREASIERIHGLFDEIQTILATAKDADRATSDVADELALERIVEARHS
jgi:leucine dehydrogenase